MPDPVCTTTDHQQAAKEFAAEASALGTVAMGLGLVRLVLAGLGVWILVSLLSNPPWWGWIALGLILFGFLVLGLIQQVVMIVGCGLKRWLIGTKRVRLGVGESLGSGKDGSDQIEGWHPFARDLDVCGPGGLIQRLNTGLSQGEL